MGLQSTNVSIMSSMDNNHEEQKNTLGKYAKPGYALLPYIPFRKFAVKGILSGSLFVLLFLFLLSPDINISAGISIFLFIITISSYLAMNFTGATPFTSPSGVEKEMKQFIPVQLISLLVSAGLWIYSAF